jgi:hypothetical protein
MMYPCRRVYASRRVTGSRVRRFKARPRLFAPSVLFLSALLLAIGASNAQGSSLVYINAGNIWLANPDGSGQYQVTLDGTASEPYSSPSEADNGTIETVRGGKIYRMTQNGTLLNAPFTTAAPGTGPLDPLISPDGSKVSFWAITGVNPCYPFVCFGTANSYQISYADHWVDPATFAPNYAGWASYGQPTWLSNSRQLLFLGTSVLWYYDLGQSEPVEWFAVSKTFVQEGAASRDGTRLALLALNEEEQQYQIALFSASGDLATGNKPAEAVPRCVIRPPDGTRGTNNGEYPGSGSLFDSLSWSPDGSSLAYEYNGSIWVAHIANVAECPPYSIGRIATGGDPYWGAPNVEPPPRPVANPNPNPNPNPKPGPTPPCSGLLGAQLQTCHAKQTYMNALASCGRKFRGTGKTARAHRAACRRQATTTYHRALALIKCAQIKGRHKRAQCEHRAKLSR